MAAYTRRGNFGGAVLHCVLWLNNRLRPTTKVSKEVNRKLPPRNTTVLSSTPRPTLRATMDSVTDRQTDRQTDDSVMLQYDRLNVQWNYFSGLKIIVGLTLKFSELQKLL